MKADTWQILVAGVWTNIPAPSTWTWSYQDLSSDESGRDLSGTLHKDIIGVKRKNQCTWENRTAEVAKSIMQAAKTSIFISFRYYDVFDGADKTITVYTGDITATAQNACNTTVYTISLSFIEQ